MSEFEPNSLSSGASLPGPSEAESSTGVETPRGRQADPTRIRTRSDFARELSTLREAADVTVRRVAARVRVQGAHSTVGDWFAGRGLPSSSSRELFVAVLAACGVTGPSEVEEWIAAWQRARRTPGRRPGGPTPYQGLASYRVEDAEWFFGRFALTRELVARVRDRRAAGGGIQVVVGASGSGKSSLLHAGLIPALCESEPADEGGTVLALTPGLLPPDSLLALLRETAAGSVTTGSDRDGRQPAVIIVDQFEEALSRAYPEDDRQRLITLLTGFAAAGSTVVLGLRADFYADLLRFPQLVEAVRDGQVTVGPMTEQELREAIVEPARRAGVEVEEGLVDLLIREVAPRGPDRSRAHEPGVLPLLSHALHTVWQHEGGRRLSSESYRRVGGIDGAVAATADRVYEGLDPGQRSVARRLLVSLVQIAVDAVDTRRRLGMAELYALFGQEHAADVRHLLDRFVAERLLTVDQGIVTITHEALLSAWPTLRHWLETDRAELIVGQQLNAAARAWRQEDSDPAVLYRGTKLAGALDWADRHGPDLSPLARDFLTTSARHARRRSRRLRQLVAALTVLSITSGVLAGFGYQQRTAAQEQRQEAVRQRNQALSRLIAGRADRIRDTDPALAMQLSLAAFRVAPTVEARSSLLDATAAASVTRSRPFTAAAQAVAFSPDGRRLAAASADGTVRLWAGDDPRLRPVLLDAVVRSPGGALFAVAFSPDGGRLAAAGADRVVHMWDVREPTRPVPSPVPLVGAESTVYAVAFSPDGSVLAAAGADRTVRRWRITAPGAPRALAPLTGSAGPVHAVAFSPDGDVLAAGGADNGVRLWGRAGADRPVPMGGPLRGHSGRVTSVAFSGDGRLLASGSVDKSVRIWTVSGRSGPRPHRSLVAHTSWVNAVAFGPDDRTVVSGSSDQTVVIQDVVSGLVRTSLPHPAPVTAVAPGRDGHTLATATTDATVRFWDQPGPVLHGATDWIFNAAFSPNGPLLASASRDGGVRVWNITDSRHPELVGPPLRSSSGTFSATLAFSPDGSRLAIGTRGGPIQLWPVPAPARTTRPEVLVGPRALVETVAFSPDGRILAAGGDDGDVHLWDVSVPGRHAARGRIAGTDAIVLSAAFRPDGRLLAVATTDAAVRLFDVTDPGRPVPAGPALTGFTGYAQSVTFTPDGRHLAAGGADGTVRIWDLVDPTRPAPVGQPITGPTGEVTWITFSPDGRTLATASTDQTVWLWDVTRITHPVATTTLTRFADSVNVVTFSPDGRTLAAGSGNGVRLWDLDPARAAGWICARVGDPIDRDEWRRYAPGLAFDPPCSAKGQLND